MYFNPYSIPPFVTSIIILWLGIVVYIRNKKSQVNRSFFLMSLSTVVWLFFAAISFSCDRKELAEIFVRITNIGVFFISITMFHFTTSFLNITKLRKLVIFFYGYGLICSWLVLFTNLLIKGCKRYFWGFYSLAGKLHPIFLSIFILQIILCVFLLINYYLRCRGNTIRKQQIKYVLIGIFIFDFSSIDFTPNYGISFYPFGYGTTALFILTFAYSIVKYRLLETKLLITRTGLFVVIYSLILGIPFVIAYTFRPYLKILFGDDWWLVPTGLLTFLATTGPFIYLFIQRKAEDRLLAEQRRYQSTLRQASKGMTRIRDLNKLLNLVVHIVTRTVRLKHGSIYLLNDKTNQYALRAIRDKGNLKPDFYLDSNSPLIWNLILQKEPIVYEEVKQRTQDYQDEKLKSLEEEMHKLDAAVVIPAFVEDKLLGFIVLGEKISGKIFSQDDLSVFSVLANQSALAIENILYIEQVKDYQGQLAQSEKLAAIGRFAASIAHEVKNPLTPIKTFTEYLPQKYQDKQFVDKYSQVVSNEVNRIDSLVHQLLDFAKPSPLKLEDVDIHKLLNETLDLLSNDFVRHKIKVNSDYSDEKLITLIDANRMKQAFLNLFLNSIDAMSSGGTLSITTKSLESNKITVIIADTGIGISEENLKHIFEPFYSTKEKGTGLGLAIVYSIIKEHRGTIRVESRVKEGTKFIIELPLVL